MPGRYGSRLIARPRDAGGEGAAGARCRGISLRVLVRTLTVSPAQATTLSLVAGLAVVEAVQACAPGIALSLKWPNDVLAGKAKLAGILLELEPAANRLLTVAGIGINVGSQPEGLPYPAISLAALGRHVRPEQLFAALADAWLDYERVWDEGRGMARIRTRWLDHAANVGEEITVVLGERSVTGVFELLDDQGRLLLRNEGMLMPIGAGEVHVGPRVTAGTH